VSTLIVGPSVLEEADKPASIKTIMVPLDGSPTGELALQPALDLAEQLDAAVLLARSLQWATQAMIYGVPDVNIAKIDEDLTKASESYLANLKRDRDVDAVVLHGPPAESLIALAETRDVDLIVMTSHTRDGVPRALLGSVADRLLQAPAPVLLIRP
jgi:nucleotide-binding universal stress UspA family protein